MKIEKNECSYHVTERDLKFGEQITLNGELLIPISLLDKIQEEIKQYNRQPSHYPVDMIGIITVLQIIDKYKKPYEK